MPKKPVDYSKAVIYKIVCKDPEIKGIYVGATTDLKSRKQQHRRSLTCRNNHNYNYYIYDYIRENGGWDNFDVVKIEDYPCDDYEDLHKREREWLEYLEANLNKVIPGREKAEWYNDNKERILKRKKELYYQKQEEKKRYSKDYYWKNREKIREKQKKGKDRCPETKKEKAKDLKDKIECDCGAIVSRRNFKRHQSSSKHSNSK